MAIGISPHSVVRSSFPFGMAHPIPVLLGIVLLVAAGLKIYERVMDPTSGDASLGRGWLLILLAECEIALAIWLLSGRADHSAKRVAVAVFGLFALYNIYLIAVGQESCNCLGAYKVRPVYMLAFDVVAVAAILWAWHPLRTVTGLGKASFASRNALLAGLVVVAVGGTLFGAAVVMRQNQSAEGVAIVGESRHHFGEVVPNFKMTHVFELKNSRRDAIEIVQVKSSCGCTTTDDLTGQVILPDETREIPVSLTSGIVDGEGIYGDITVFYKPQRGGETAFQVMRVEALIRADFVVTPTFLDFGSVAVGQSVSRIVTLEPRKLTDARINTTEMSTDSFRVEPLSADGRVVRVTYTPKPASRSGFENGRLSLHTNSSTVPLVYISALGRRVVPAEVSPMAVVVGPESNGAIEREVTLTSENEFDIARIESDDPRIVTRQKNPGFSRSHTVVVTVPEARNSALNTTLKLTLKHVADTPISEAYRVSIPVHRFQTLTQEK